MDTAVPLMCAALAWLAAWVHLSSGAPDGPRLRVHARVVVHALRRALTSLASTSLCRGLLANELFRSAVDELAPHAQASGFALGMEELAAVLIVASCAVCVLAGAFSRSVFVAIAAVPLVAAAFPLRAAQHERLQKRELAGQMPGVLRTLATAMGSGQTLMQAIDYVSLHEGGAASEAFGHASLRLRCGMPAEAVLTKLSEELDAPGAGLMATALSISQRTGCPLRELFQRSALLVEQQGEFQRMLSVKTAQVRLSVRIVCVLPIAMVILLSLISPDFRRGLGTVPGVACLLIGATMDGIALMLIRAILRGVM